MRDNRMDFAALTEEVNNSIARGRPERAAALLTDFSKESGNRGQSLLAQGLASYIHQDLPRTVQFMIQASEVLVESEYPAINSLYSTAYLNSQLGIPETERPARVRGRSFYQKNLSVLQVLDPELAEEVDKSPWPDDLILIDFWGGLYFSSFRTLHIMNQDLKKKLARHLKARIPISIGGTGTGWELLFCLNHQVDLLHGMTRPHYYFEPRPDWIKAQLHLRDLSEALNREELIIFGGSSLAEKTRRIFGTLRYNFPSILVGNQKTAEPQLSIITREITSGIPKERVRDYYASEEFKGRQRRIAAGEIQPRILVNTCRWTTFLKYCARDFEKAFSRIGCDTRYLIEENDVQSILPALHWSELDAFRPDAIFMVSHSRPSMAYAPPELPFIAYIQDKCGPLADHPDLAGEITPEDLFICLSLEHQRFLVDKNVPREQTYLMPVPVDESLFYPLPEHHELAPKYAAEVGFVKHGTPHVEEAFSLFLRQLAAGIQNERMSQGVAWIFKDLYRFSCQDLDTCWYEPEMEEFVFSRVSSFQDELRHFLKLQVAKFHCTVYSPAWRYQFLEALDQAGIEVALYGKNWSQNKRLSHLDRGPVDRERELNFVYNFNRVNLSINHSLSMTHRMVECALAGGFLMAAAHAREKDYLPASDYFEPERELVLFDSRQDLIDRCRHYLAHPRERQDIARAMRERALRNHTCVAGATSVLKKWRELLRSP